MKFEFSVLLLNTSANGRKSRIGSSPGVRASRSAVSSNSSIWPTGVTWPANRSITPDPAPNNLEKKIQRPKTVKIKCTSCPCHHFTKYYNQRKPYS